jgi:hypothetical protein
VSTSIITGNVTNAAGTAMQYVTVRVRLLPRPAFKTSTGAELSPTIYYTTDASGNYAMTLERTADITPANSYYEVTEFISPRYGGSVKHLIQVGSGNTTVLASLVSTPPAPTLSTYLTQASADLRYQQLNGYGATGDLSTIDPDDAAAAGVLTTAARSDHQHAIVAAVAGESRPADTAAEGNATSFARSNHVHDREFIYGTAAARAALAGTDLVPGLVFFESDTFQVYKYTNSAWVQIAIATSDTAANKPATNFIGQRHFVTDAANITGTGIYTPDTTSQPARVGNEWHYNGTRWQYGEWGKPWGVAGVASNASSTQVVTAEADVTGMTLTFTAAANRRYKITGQITGQKDATAALVALRIFVAGAGIGGAGAQLYAPASQYNTINAVGYATPAAASTIVKLRASAGAGNFTVDFANITAWLIVEDIGPNGAPA